MRVTIATPKHRTALDGQRNALRAVAMLLFAMSALEPNGFSQSSAPALTSVKDTVYKSDGSPATGSVVISWDSFLSQESKPIFGGSKTITLNNGALLVALIPNIGATPSGTSYTVRYYQSGAVYAEEFWVVPNSTPTAPPTQPSVSTIGASGSNTYCYWISATRAVGETTLSPGGCTFSGHNSLSANNFNRVSWNAVSGAISYRVFRTPSNAMPTGTGLFLVATTASLTLDDQSGTLQTATIPEINTTDTRTLQQVRVTVPPAQTVAISPSQVTGTAIVSTPNATQTITAPVSSGTPLQIRAQLSNAGNLLNIFDSPTVPTPKSWFNSSGAFVSSVPPIINTFSSGSLLLAGSGGQLSESNNQLFWDTAAERLRVGPRTGLSTLLQNSINIYKHTFTLLNPPAGTTASLGALSQSNNAGSYNIAAYTVSESNHASGNRSASIGLESDAYHTGAGTISDLQGIFAFADNTGPAGGNATRVTAIAANAWQSGSATTSEMNGLLVFSNGKSGGTVSNNYGVKIEDQTGGTNNWAIKTGLGKVEFGGPVTAPRLNSVRFADQFAGADAGAKIAAAIADLPAQGGTVDARGFEGSQYLGTPLVIDRPIHLLLGAAQFGYTGTGAAIQVSATTGSGVTIEGVAASDATAPDRSTTIIIYASSANGIDIANNQSIHIKDISVLGPSMGTGKGIIVTGNGFMLENTQTSQFGSNGTEINGTRGNSNGGLLLKARSYNNGGDGFHVFGADSNNIGWIQTDAIGNANRQYRFTDTEAHSFVGVHAQPPTDLSSIAFVNSKLARGTVYVEPISPFTAPSITFDSTSKFNNISLFNGVSVADAGVGNSINLRPDLTTGSGDGVTKRSVYSLDPGIGVYEKIYRANTETADTLLKGIFFKSSSPYSGPTWSASTSLNHIYNTAGGAYNFRIFNNASGDVSLATPVFVADENSRVGFGVAEPGSDVTLKSTHVLGWDNGSGSTDTVLYRNGSGTLRTDGVFIVGTAFQSAAADPADAGAIRLGNSEVIASEASPSATDGTIRYNASEQWELNSPLAFDGNTADGNKSIIAVTDPTATRTFILPNADSNPVQPAACSGTDKVSAISSTGVITCSADQGGSGSGGDNMRVEDGDNAGTFTTMNDADFDDSGDIDFQRGAGSPDSVIGVVRTNSVALATDTTGNYVGSVADGTGIDGTANGEGATYTPSLDLTEINSHTFGDNSAATLTQTFDPTGATNPAWSYSNGIANLSAGTLQQGGSAVALQSVTLTAGSGLTGGGDISASRNFDIAVTAPIEISSDTVACSTCTTASNSQSFTNKTFDSEGSGNVLVFPQKIEFQAAGCDGSTAASAYDLPSSNAPSKSCQGTSPHRFGVLDFADAATALTANVRALLPSDWTATGGVDIKYIWSSASTSTNSAVWTIQTSCVADGEDVANPTYNAAQTVADANNAAANTRNSASISGITMTGCSAGESLFLKIGRDPTNASDTLAATALLQSIEITIRRQI